MTQEPLHPSQLSYSLTVATRANLTSCCLIGIVWVLIVAAGFIKNPLAKTIILGSGVAVAIATRPLRKLAIDSERLNDDIRDISLTSFQRFLYDRMQPSESVAVLDAEVINTDADALDVPILDPSEASKAHHTIISGPTGAGKSELVKWLVGRYFQGSRVRVYDCDAAPHDWHGLEVIGRRGDFIGISGAMLSDLELLDKRCALLGRGQDVGGEEVRICEELPTVAAELTEMIEPDDEERKGRQQRRRVSVASNWLKRIARRGRKYRIKLILITQETSVAAMGIEGEGTIRKAFTIFYLGAAALEQADKLRSKDKPLAIALLQYLQGCSRPCLVDHKGKFYVVNIPDLTHANRQFQPAPAIAPRNDTRSDEGDIRSQLEMLYQKDSSPLPDQPLSPSDKPVDSPKIDPGRAKRVTEMKRQGLSQTQIIQIEWQVKPGDSQRYRDAVAEYKSITGET